MLDLSHSLRVDRCRRFSHTFPLETFLWFDKFQQISIKQKPIIFIIITLLLDFIITIFFFHSKMVPSFLINNQKSLRRVQNVCTILNNSRNSMMPLSGIGRLLLIPFMSDVGNQGESCEKYSNIWLLLNSMSADFTMRTVTQT